eukprot:5898314-Karenia_brevis.AAC.1
MLRIPLHSGFPNLVKGHVLVRNKIIKANGSLNTKLITNMFHGIKGKRLFMKNMFLGGDMHNALTLIN